MHHAYRPALLPKPPLYRTPSIAPRGLVAGMFDARGSGDVIDQATHHNPAMRDLTVGEAVKAMGLHGLGCINQALDRVPRFFQPKRPSRLIALRVPPEQRHDAALGRAFDTLSAPGVTARSRRMAATAAQRLGLAPRLAQLESTSLHVDGRDNRDAEPDERVMPITRGYRRDKRPARNQVLLDFSVAHQAGRPVLRQPRSGTSRDATDCGQSMADPMAQLQIPDGLPSLGAASAL